MKQSGNLKDEELQLIETINRMSRQINFHGNESGASKHSMFLMEFIEHLEDQLESIRKSRHFSSAG